MQFSPEHKPAEAIPSAKDLEHLLKDAFRFTKELVQHASKWQALSILQPQSDANESIPLATTHWS